MAVRRLGIIVNGATGELARRQHLPALVATSTWMAGHLGRPSPSAVVRALT